MAKNDDLIVELLKEVREEQRTHSTILIELQNDVAINTKDLTEHKEGVIQNRKRIEKLEQPAIALGLIKKTILGLGAVSASLLGILKFLNYL